MIKSILLQRPTDVMALPNLVLKRVGVIFGPLLLHGGSIGSPL